MQFQSFIDFVYRFLFIKTWFFFFRLKIKFKQMDLDNAFHFEMHYFALKIDKTIFNCCSYGSIAYRVMSHTTKTYFLLSLIVIG